MIAQAESTVDYTLKEGPHSSHSLLMRRLPEPGRGLRVLDLGCGPGYLASRIAARGYRVTGVERPGGTGANFPEHVRLVQGDLDFGLPELDGYFDIVLCADILEHLRDPARLLRQTRAAMAPGAILVASLPNSGNFYFRWKVLTGQFPQDDKGLFDRTHVRFYMWDGWVELLDEAGFAIDSFEPTCVPVGLALPRYAHTAPVRAAEKVSYVMARIWKRLFAYQFVVAARPKEVIID